MIGGNGGNWWSNRLLLFWVYLVRIDLLLIDGGGGFDHENVKFAWLLLINLLLFWVQPTLLVYFVYFFVFLDLMEIRFGCWIWIWGLPEISLVVVLFLRFGKNLKNMFLQRKKKIIIKFKVCKIMTFLIDLSTTSVFPLVW